MRARIGPLAVAGRAFQVGHSLQALHAQDGITSWFLGSGAYFRNCQGSWIPMNWLEQIALLVTVAAGSIGIWEWLRKRRNRITGQFTIEVFPAEADGPNPWDPPVPDPNGVDGILVTAIVHNNTDAPVVPTGWRIEGPDLIDGPPFVRADVIAPKQTATISTAFLPDWSRWDKQLKAGLTERASPRIRCTLEAIGRESSDLLRARSEWFHVDDQTVRGNARRALNRGDGQG